MCAAIKRVYVHEDDHDSLVRAPVHLHTSRQLLRAHAVHHAIRTACSAPFESHSAGAWH